MNRFTKNKITTAISTVFIMSSSCVYAADNLIQQADFENGVIDQWVSAGGTPTIIDDATLNSKVLEVSGRSKDSSAAKQTLSGLVAGHTYRFTSKLRTTSLGANVGIGMSYRADLTKADGSPKDTYTTIGTLTPSAGDWVEYSAEFTLPEAFDDSMPAKIWIKSGGGTVTSVYGDDFNLVDLDGDNPPSQYSKPTTYTDDAGNSEYWTANDLLGNKLDVMRLAHSDDLVNPIAGKTSFSQIDTWLTEEGNTDWRWATLAEMQAIHTFFDGADNATNIASFLQLNGGAWAPKEGTEEWTALIPTESQSLDEGTDPHNAPAYKIGVNNLTTSFGAVSYAKNFNANGLVGAGLLVREVSDAITLEISAPSDINVEATATASSVTLGTPVVVGGIAPVEAAVADNNGPFTVGTHTVTWSVTDADSVLVTAEQVVIVTDTTAATFDTLSDITIEASSLSTDVAMPTVNASDLVDGDIVATNDAQASYAVGSYVINWTAIDTAENLATTSQNLIVQDTTNPVFEVLADINIEVDGGQANVIISPVSASDSVDGSIIATRDLADGLYDAGEHIITWTATDAAGNSQNASQKLIIIDISDPIVFDGVLETINVEASDTLSDVSLIAPTANGGTITATADFTGPFSVGEHTITWTASEGEDSLTQIQTVIITDSQAPVFGDLADVHVEATGAETEIAMASIVTNDIVDGDVIETNDAPATLVIGSHDITWTATDTAGNSSNKVQKVIVEDTTSPIFADAINVIIEATGIETNVALVAPMVTDVIDAELIVANDAPDLFPLGDTTVTWSTVDTAGNTATIDQLITIVDTIAPVFSALTSLVFDATDTGTASVIIPSVLAIDSVDGEVYASADLVDGEFAEGTYTITWTAMDAAGNESTTNQTITVNAFNDNPESSYSNNNSYSSDDANNYWTINNIAGNKLDIMRLAASDDVGNENASFATVELWLSENTDWRFGTSEELVALQAFFDLATAAENGNAYFELSNSQWAPTSSPSFWNVLIPAEAKDPADPSPAFGFKFSSSVFGTVGYKKNFNASAAGAAVLLVREVAAEVIDTDGDGYADDEDAFPYDADEWLDTDNDGTGNNADTDDDNDGVLDTEDDLPLDASETVDTDNDGIGNNADTDDDGDGVADEDDQFPLDSTEWVDTDNDGLGNNADEDDDNDGVLDIDDAYPLDPEKWLDDSPPILNDVAEITIDAKGKLTLLTQHNIGLVQAVDEADGVIDAEIVSETKLASGRHEVVWRATDKVGNFSEITQIVNINPLVNFAMDKLAEAGSDVKARIYLSGEAPTYPVELELVVSGSASDGTHTASTQVITLDSTKAEYTFSINADAEIVGGETIELTLFAATNAALGSKVSHTTTLIAENVAPIVRVSMIQGDKKTLVISKDSVEPVIVTAHVRDSNLADRGNHSISWHASDPAIIDFISDENSSTFEFDVSLLVPGIYHFEVSATEDREDALTTSTNFSFIVIESLPELIADADSDNDGILDTEEGFADSDDDGIMDYLDNESDTSILSMGNGNAKGKSINTQSGLSLKLGRASLLAKGLAANGVSVTEEDLMALGNSLGKDTSKVEDPNYSSVSDIIDFELSGLLEIGSSAAIVIPLADGVNLPENAVYRKFNIDTGWSDFIEGNGNAIASAPVSDTGLCPAVNSVEYISGLNEGDNCIQLTMVDGGEYDHDGLANGVIVDPAKVAIDARSFIARSTVSSIELNEGEMITLDVSSSEIGDQALTYTWRQLSGITMNLPSDDTTVTVTTEVPQVLEDENIVVEVTVSNGSQYDTTLMSFTVLQTTAIITPIATLSGGNSETEKLRAGTTISLDASGSYDSDFNSLSYTWLQTSGPQVVLSDNQSSTATFVVPDLGSDAKISFEVTISNGLDTVSSTNFTSVDAVIEGNYKDKSGGSTGLWTLLLLGFGSLRRTKK